MAHPNPVREQSRQSSNQSSPSDQVPLKTWIGLFGAMLGAFMGITLLVCAIALLFTKKVRAGATAGAH